MKNEKETLSVKIKKLNPNAIIPTRGSDEAAGYDLYACIDAAMVIFAHSTEIIHTGLSIQPPNGYFGAIFARSGLSTKQGLRPANAVGVCDRDYTGEYVVALHNDSDKDRFVFPGDRIAQLIFLPYQDVDFLEVDDLEATSRNDGGFGSTGV